MYKIYATANIEPIENILAKLFLLKVFLIWVLHLVQANTRGVATIMLITAHVAMKAVSFASATAYLLKVPPIENATAANIAKILPFSLAIAFIGSRIPFLLSDAFKTYPPTATNRIPNAPYMLGNMPNTMNSMSIAGIGVTARKGTVRDRGDNSVAFMIRIFAVMNPNVDMKVVSMK